MADNLTTGEFVAILYDLLVSAGLEPPTGWEEDLVDAVVGWTATPEAEGFTTPGLNLKVASTLSNVGAVPNQMRAWWLGTATGGYKVDGTPVGPGGDPDGGYYPLRDGTGKTTYLPSPVKVLSVLQKGDKGDQGDPGLGLSPWSTKTASYAASSGDRIECNSAGGSFNVTAPSSGEFWVRDLSGSFGVNSVTVLGNGKTIEGYSSYVLDSPGKQIHFKAVGTTWAFSISNVSGF